MEIRVKILSNRNSEPRIESSIQDEKPNRFGVQQAVSEIGDANSSSSKAGSVKIRLTNEELLLRQMAQLEVVRQEVEQRQQFKKQKVNDGHQNYIEQHLDEQKQFLNGQIYSGVVSDNMKEIIQNYEQKVDQLQQAIIGLKEENESSKFETLKEFQQIKELLFNLKKPKGIPCQMNDPFATKRAEEEIVLLNDDDRKKWEILDNLTTTSKVKNNFRNTQQAFSQKPTLGAEILSNADKVFLINKGIHGLLDETKQLIEEINLDERDLIIEYNDKYQASLFQIQIVAFQLQVNQFDECQLKRNNSFLSQNYYIPEKMFFTFNFFQFDKENTDIITYENYGSNYAIKQLLTDNKPTILKELKYLQNGIGLKQKVWNFQVDPSIMYPTVHQDFVDYLFRKSLHIEMWDANSKMLYGCVNVPLRSLLRQGRLQVEKQISVPIIDQVYSTERGKLFLFLSNRGFEPQNQDFQSKIIPQGLIEKSELRNYKIKQEYSSMIAEIENKQSSEFKKKIRSFNPTNIEESITFRGQIEGSANVKKNDPGDRQRERIRRFKNKYKIGSSEDLIDEFRAGNPKDQHFKNISLFQTLKDDRKQEYLKNIVLDYESNEIQYDAKIGQIEYIQKIVRNNSNSQELFMIQIEDPDLDHIGFSEFQTISQQDELRFLMDKLGIQAPNDFTFDKDEKGRVTFILYPGSEVILFFKFLTYREIDPELTNRNNLAKLYQTNQTSYFKKFINPRKIKVNLNSKNSKDLNSDFTYLIKAHKQVVDKVFKFYERENKQASISFPVIYSQGSHNKGKPIIYCTNQNVQLEWISDNEINMNIRVPKAGQTTYFNIFVYQDNFKFDLIANWEVEIYSLEGIDVIVDMGRQKQIKLAINSDSTRLVKFYSSHPQNAWFDDKFNQATPLQSGKVNSISLLVRTSSLIMQRVQINCIDQSSKEVIYSWILNLSTDRPVVSKIYDLKILLHREPHIQKFRYQNRTLKESSFTFESSQISLLQIIDTRTFLSIGESAQIAFRISRREQPGIGEVFIFVTDEGERTETILFKLHFVLQL